MIKDCLKGGYIMMSNSGNNIIYLDYTTSATSGINYNCSSKEDSLVNIMRDNILIIDNISMAATNDLTSQLNIQSSL